MRGYDGAGEDVVPAYDEAYDIKEALDSAYNARLFNPLDQSGALDRLVQVRRQWADRGDTVIFTAGGYDLLHLNHIASLLGAKINGVRHRYEAGEHAERPWESLTARERKEHITAGFKEAAIKLVVSIKGDQELAAKKSFRAEKGNTSRPIQDWRTRARSVLSVAAPDGYSPGYLVDAVTIDDNADQALAGTPNHNLIDIVRAVAPDAWQIYAESKNLLRFVASQAFGENVRIFKTDTRDYYVDDASGEPLSTTLFVKKVLGQTSVRHTLGIDDSYTSEESSREI